MAAFNNELLFLTKNIQLTQEVIIIPEGDSLVSPNPYHHYWDFFHTMAEKMKDTDFSNFGREFVSIVIQLISTLHCKACREDAEKYVIDHNYFKISSKEELKLALFDFHNYVNEKLQHPLFTQTELNEKYAAMDAIYVMKRMVASLQKDYKFDLYIYNNEVRTPFLWYLKDWLNTHYKHFI